MRSTSSLTLSILAAAVAVAAPRALPAQQSGGADAAVRREVRTAHQAAVVAEAAMRGDRAEVRRLLAQGANANLAQGDGMTALHWAAEHGDSPLAADLIKAGAKVTATTRIGSYTPLHVAAREGSAAVVRLLLKAGSDPSLATSTGATALHLAATAGDAGSVNALLDHHADPNVREHQWGQTPLVFAAEADRAEVIRVLLKRGADPSLLTRVVNLPEQEVQDAAAARRRNDVLRSFEPKPKADSTVAAKTGAGADSARDAAMPSMAMTTGGPPPQPPTAGVPNGGVGGANGGRGGGRGGPPPPKGPFTPDQMQQAIAEGRKVLLEPPKAGEKAAEADTSDGQVAGYSGTVGSMGGLSALHHAVRQGNVEAVLALLDGGADINEVSGADSTTPLLLATINGQFDVAMQLIKRGANPNLASTANVTPLYAAINTEWAPKSRYPQPEAVQNQKTSYLEVMTALLDAGAQPNVRVKHHPWYFAYNNCGNANCGLENLEGTTPFWRAAYAVDVDAMKLLVAHGADPNIPSQRTVDPNAGRGGRGGRGGGRGGARGGRGPDPNAPPLDSAALNAPVGIGVYPVHAAAGVGYGNGFAGNSHRHAPDGWMPAMKYLVEELHANVNERDPTGYTPLHHAAARGDNEMIMYLVAHGADVKAVARNGRTTVDMANGPVQRVRPFPETIALLEKLGAKNNHRCVSC